MLHFTILFPWLLFGVVLGIAVGTAVYLTFHRKHSNGEVYEDSKKLTDS